MPSSKVNTFNNKGSKLSKDKEDKKPLIDFKLHIKCTGETFLVSQCSTGTKIRHLKGLLEFITGIPSNLQRLSYLDDGELTESSEISEYDVIDGALMIMEIWTIYRNLVVAAVRGNIEELLKEGVSAKVNWTSPTSDYMFKKDRKAYIQERSGIALFILAHRGNVPVIKNLLDEHNAHVNYSSMFGRTPLMVAVANNKLEIIDALLNKDANIEIEDMNGDDAFGIAKLFNNKQSLNRLTQHKWKKRIQSGSKSSKKATDLGSSLDDENIFTDGRCAYQMFDSSKKTWLKGDFMQMYMMNLVPGREFSGSHLSAPHSVGREVLRRHRAKSSESINKQSGEIESDPRHQQHSFDNWLAKKLKMKKIEREKKKKQEQRELQAQADLIEESSKDKFERTFERRRMDNNQWMKDYSNEYSGSDYAMAKSAHELQRQNRRSQLDALTFHKGMTYEEWIRVRDEFLTTHKSANV